MFALRHQQLRILILSHSSKRGRLLPISPSIQRAHSLNSYSSTARPLLKHQKMGKNGKKSRSTPPGEEYLLLPQHPHLVPATLEATESAPAKLIPIVDTHTHLVSTFEAYRKAYKTGKYQTIWDFARGLYVERGVEAVVDVWCEAPVQKSSWKDLADSALTEEDRKSKWGGLEYWFVMGECISMIVDNPRPPHRRP